MDCSWLVDNTCDDGPGSESDGEEIDAEVESRLYSIIHHSDLSQPLPSDLAKHYSIQCGEDGKLTVALNNSLEIIKSEETRKVDQLINDSAFDDDDVPDVLEISCTSKKDEVEIIDEISSGQRSFKRFRYSDVDIDSFNEQTKKSITSFNRENISSDTDFFTINYFEVPPNFFKTKKLKKLRNLKIPTSYTTCKSIDWKDSANESFIPVLEKNGKRENYIIDQMVYALKKANPSENSEAKLYSLARALYFKNHKKCREPKKNCYTMESRCGDDLFSSSKDEVMPIYAQKSKEKQKSRTNNARNIFDGSISLNISPFKPHHPTVDLVSEDENDQTNIISKINERKWKSLPLSDLPSKWTMKMVRFYTKPSQSKMKMELRDIFDNLKKNSTADDWRLDPRDEMGFYQRNNPLRGRHRNRRCPNCNERGHLMQDCPSPRKTPTCFLCGLSYHSAYSCPNRICLKCGDRLSSDAYECESCYQSTFNYDIPCGVCGQVTHRTEICPDSWRSFHATVAGEKKVPKNVVENKRKYCCNCASNGHFSHQCPFPSCEGEHLSSFVTNYSASPSESGSTKVVVPLNLSHIFENEDANTFLQNLSNSTNAVINVEEGPINYTFQISGTFVQCRKVKSEIEGYINTRKRKRREPRLQKKRRRLR